MAKPEQRTQRDLQLRGMDENNVTSTEDQERGPKRTTRRVGSKTWKEFKKMQKTEEKESV